MDIPTDAFEKLGAFYLGREYELSKQQLLENLVLYDSKDLVTHGVVLGMTGSGKTGLCMALLEEAAMDNVPAIVIDPKGDIANLLLTFPELRPEDFRPWINEDDARKKGVSPDQFAAKQAEMWKKGLADWGQGPDRIQALKDKVDMAVYTPGSSAGLPVSVLSSLEVPDFEVLDDAEILGDRIESTVSSLLSLIGVDADPIQDPEHIVLSNIFSHCWRAGESITLESLIRHIQVPPFTKVGVMDLETVCPEKERQALAMRMNNLLASPGFAAWLEGEPLNPQRMLYTPEGKPRISIFSIAHLGDAERMFFVSLLLNQTLGWMRAQSGTTSLRALLYMDEIYGYLPPTANPPSKKPLMTMLKQARAFGLGVLLATQNPVDLDYKALSNIGTWFLGRLQTERDKARVLDGLEGAAATQDGGFDRGKMEQLLAGLGARVFLMNNVHEDAPVTFHVRWVMSYLRGPLARREIKTLMDSQRKAAKEAAPTQAAPPEKVDIAVAASGAPTPAAESSGSRPRLPRNANEYFAAADPEIPLEELRYAPAVIRVGEVRYEDAKKDIHGTQTAVLVHPVDAKSGEADLSRQIEWPGGWRLDHLSGTPREGIAFDPLPSTFSQSKTFTSLSKDLVDWLYGNHSVAIFESPLTGKYSHLGETEGDFRARLALEAREIRDRKVEELREAYEKKIRAEEDDVQRALDHLEEQKAQAGSATTDTLIRAGSVLLSFLQKRSITAKSRSAMSGVSRSWKESRDVARAKDKVEREKEEVEDLEAEAERAIEELRDQLDPLKETFEEVRLTPYKKNCSAKSVGIVWVPSRIVPPRT